MRKREGTGAISDDDDKWATPLRPANAGDGRACAVFLRVVALRLRGIVVTRGRSLGSEACEDILQEIPTAIHLKRATWREDAPLRP